MKTQLLVLLMVFTIAYAAAAPLPDAPKPAPMVFHVKHSPVLPPNRRMGKADWILLGSVVAVRGLDVYSTHRMIENGYHELILPKSIASSVPAMCAFSAGAAAGDWFLGRELRRHGHRRLERVMRTVDFASTGFWASHNLVLGIETKPKIIVPPVIHSPGHLPR